MKKPKTIKKRIEMSFEGKLVYALVEILARLLGLNKLHIEKGLRLGAIKKKVLGIRCRIGYEYNFKHLDLKRAYEFRVEHFLAIVFGVLGVDEKAARRYLSVVAEKDLVDLLNLDEHHKYFLREQNLNDPAMFDNRMPERKSVSNMLMCGPGADPNEIDFECYDYVVFNKPPPSSLNIDARKIILILNNQWVLNKSEELKGWFAVNSDSTVISPRQIDQEHKRNEVFDHLPKFLLGASLMGLQRNLFIINRLYETKHLDVFGFDFSLSREPYSKWYPSLIKKKFGDLNSGIIFSNSMHDFLLNVMYTRKFLRQNEYVNGEIRRICEQRAGEILYLFEKRYSRQHV